MARPNVVSTATMSFAGETYKVKNIPAGKPESCEAIDVTCCDDSKKKFVKGALKVNGEITVVTAGSNAPAVNQKGSLLLSLSTGAVNVGIAVCRSVEPSTIESGGNREITNTCVFQPVGA